MTGPVRRQDGDAPESEAVAVLRELVELEDSAASGSTFAARYEQIRRRAEAVLSAAPETRTGPREEAELRFDDGKVLSLVVALHDAVREATSDPGYQVTADLEAHADTMDVSFAGHRSELLTGRQEYVLRVTVDRASRPVPWAVTS